MEYFIKTFAIVWMLQASRFGNADVIPEGPGFPLGPEMEPYKYTIHNKYVDWNTAKASCEAIGETLLILDSWMKLPDVQTQLPDVNQEEPWIGLRDKDNNNVFVFLNGEVAGANGFDNWTPGGPTNGINNCVYMDDNWEWDDYDCDHPKLFVCEGHETDEVPSYGEWTFTEHNANVTWSQAKSNCETIGQRLAVLDSMEKIMDASAQIDPHASEPWIGFRDAKENDIHVWLNGEVLETNGFAYWSTGDPHNGNEDCGRIDDTWSWRDSDCDGAFPYICERLGKCPESHYKPTPFSCEPCPAGTIPRVDLTACVDPAEHKLTYTRHNMKVSWEKAQEACEAVGDRLVVVDSEEKKSEVAMHVDGLDYAYYWVGNGECASYYDWDTYYDGCAEGYGFVCEGDATPFIPTHGKWTFTLSSDSADWSQAKLNCEAMGQRLAVLDGMEKIMDASAQITDDFSDPWIGFHDADSNDVHVWLSGEPVEVPFKTLYWSSSNPSHGSDDCGHVGDGWMWGDDECHHQVEYICEHLTKCPEGYYKATQFTCDPCPSNDVCDGIGEMKYTLHDMSVEWSEAKEACESVGTKLVVIDSEQKKQDVQSQIVLGNKEPWIGFRDRDGNDAFIWINEERIGETGFDNWADGTRETADDYGYLNKMWEWDACDCASRVFICEGNVTSDVPAYGEWIFTLYGETTWYQAKSNCEAMGQRLAVLDSMEKIMDASAQIRDKGVDPWIGFNDVNNNNVHVWFNGEEVESNGFVRWESGSPSNADSDCGYVGAGWRWGDDACDHDVNYMCEHLNRCPAGQYKAAPFTCELCPGNTIKSVPDGNDHCNNEPACDGVTNSPTEDHTACVCNYGFDLHEDGYCFASRANRYQMKLSDQRPTGSVEILQVVEHEECAVWCTVQECSGFSFHQVTPGVVECYIAMETTVTTEALAGAEYYVSI